MIAIAILTIFLAFSFEGNLIVKSHSIEINNNTITIFFSLSSNYLLIKVINASVETRTFILNLYSYPVPKSDVEVDSISLY
jgi:hypothetical protein